jgi:hypothetical protein
MQTRTIASLPRLIRAFSSIPERLLATACRQAVIQHAVWLYLRFTLSPEALHRDFSFAGHFRQILSTLTRNGRDPARLRDGQDGIVR